MEVKGSFFLCNSIKGFLNLYFDTINHSMNYILVKPKGIKQLLLTSVLKETFVFLLLFLIFASISEIKFSIRNIVKIIKKSLTFRHYNCRILE